MASESVLNAVFCRCTALQAEAAAVVRQGFHAPKSAGFALAHECLIDDSIDDDEDDELHNYTHRKES